MQIDGCDVGDKYGTYLQAFGVDLVNLHSAIDNEGKDRITPEQLVTITRKIAALLDGEGHVQRLLEVAGETLKTLADESVPHAVDVYGKHGTDLLMAINRLKFSRTIMPRTEEEFGEHAE